MSVLDVNKIINGTPVKRLKNGYNKMKENYTAESAHEYYDIYSNEPLSFLLENSRLIFSEPYLGEAFYESCVTEKVCCFTQIENEREKVLSYIEENGDKMNEGQKSLYDKLATYLESLSEQTKRTQMYASYIKENIDDRFEEVLSNALYAYEKSEEKDNSQIEELFESVENPTVFFTYAPYVAGIISSNRFNTMVKNFCEMASVPTEYDEEQWKTYVETVICGNALNYDKAYVEAVNNIQNRSTRTIFEYYMNTSIKDKLEELVTESVSKDIYHVTRTSAVNSIFMDMYEASLGDGSNEEFKEELEIYKGIAYEATLNLIVADYQSSNDTSEVVPYYTLLGESVSIEQAFETVNNMYQSSTIFALEAGSDDDVTDDDLDNMERDISGNEGTDGKKPQAPKPKNLANKVQFSAMDKEAKQQRKMSIRQQKGQEVKNAVNAVTALPKNVIDSIKGQVKQLDEKDDERRKNYMTEPGFRKKAFRNLKVAILYGTAAQAKLAFVPIVMMCRHLSKKKDRRIRNELIREIETEIKVTEEKINDANANGDTKEKYKLIRIKDRLDAELVRVKVNSKYV